MSDTDNIKKRFLLFLFGCIGLRSYIVYFAKTASKEYVKILAYFTLIVAIGFIYLFLTGKRQTGLEVFGDKIWWNNLRPVHALLYLIFSFNIIILDKNLWEVLAIDVIIGLIAFINHHYNIGSFNKF